LTQRVFRDQPPESIKASKKANDERDEADNHCWDSGAGSGTGSGSGSHCGRSRSGPQAHLRSTETTNDAGDYI
jgi:hypothetical protein